MPDNTGKIEPIADSIKKHRELEIQEAIREPAIGRSEVQIDDRRKIFWIVNSWNNNRDVLPDTDDNESVTKNSRLGGILIQNYKGGHDVEVRNRFREIDNQYCVNIFNRVKHVPSRDRNVLAADIAINFSGDDEKTYYYRNLVEIIEQETCCQSIQF